MSKPALTPIDSEIRKALESIFKKDPELAHRFGAISGIQPSARVVQAKPIGYAEGDRILSYLAPDVVAGADRRLAHMEFGDEGVVLAGTDVVGFNGKVRTSEVATKLVEETVEAHGWGTHIDNDEVKVAAASGINLVAAKSQLPRQVVEGFKELNGANFFKATSSYASSSHYSTLSGTTKFSDYSTPSDPLKTLSDLRAFITTACGRQPDTLGMGQPAMETLSWHPKILDLLKMANTLGRGIPVTSQILAQLLNMNVVVGTCIYTPQTGVAPVSVWDDNVFMDYVGDESNPTIAHPRFAMTATSPDYPQVIPMQSSKGLAGSQEIRYGDVYKTYSGKKSAGGALFDVK